MLLVASIPLAMEVVTTTTLAIGTCGDDVGLASGDSGCADVAGSAPCPRVGSRELSSVGTIVARLSAIEELAGSACVWALVLVT